MAPEVKILIIEHNPIDTELLKSELDSSFGKYIAHIVQSKKEYEKELRDFQPNIILSEYTIPTFNWQDALKIKQQIAPGVPFLLLSNNLDVEAALDLIKEGVTDCVLSHKSASLVPKIMRALKDAETNLKREAENNTLKSIVSNLRTVFDNTDIGSVFIDTNFVIKDFNAVSSIWAMSAFGQELELDKSLRSMVEQDRLPNFDQFTSTILNGNNLNYEISYPKPDNTPMWFIINGQRVIESEKIIGICLSATNITTRKLIEDETRKLNAVLEEKIIERTAKLMESNAALEAFSYTVSHDLRAPLRAINGYTKILKEDYGSGLNAEAEKIMDGIISNTKRMGQLIDDLLKFYRIGRGELVISEIDIQDMVEDICSDMQVELRHRNIEFKIGDLPSAMGDKAAIKQVWINLISNAVKYTRLEKNACVEITSEFKDGKLVYNVKDNGAGFDMRYALKLFGVFNRLHSDEVFEGTGVGLAIVKQIVNRLGGNAWAIGKLNEGATFSFSLPMASGDKPTDDSKVQKNEVGLKNR
jgi:signal transduction histidine kinase